MNKPKVSLSTDKIKNITFFEEDIAELTHQLNTNEGLYRDFYGIYKELSGGKYSNIKSARDIAEIAKALVQLRALCSDTTYKRHQVRKNLSDIVYRSDGGETNADDVIKETARVIINEVRRSSNKELLLNGPLAAIKETGNGKSIAELNELNNAVKSSIDKGEISLSTNDKLIGVSEFVEFKYDQSKKEFIAVDKRNGGEIPNFPRDRLPKNEISRFNREWVVTNTGDKFEIIVDD
jgi:hypothetical protein